ncbi:tetratricopeptide repeat protein [Caviibacterium pharyngocola]|uniref:Sel1 repeat family protein n=1 Tax=Caviibacterium pharyngocola TaxID=28159 RepID=A0A2M8RTN2_9PAST|nr:tetratricopeptide repeat protein [Caviibacterium pharyngocola]PJG82247.1 sel1 repeat family protein [Caviibacterium pharyngocola]
MKKLIYGLLCLATAVYAESDPVPEKNAITSDISAQNVSPEMSDQQRRDAAQAAANQGNWTAAFEWIYPLALKGDANAQANVGILYLQGKGVEKDTEKAYWWLSEAAEQGNIKGINYLAFMYLDGNGTKKSLPHAMKLLQKTANAKDQTAMFVLGMLYYRELKDFKNAFLWLEKAAKADHNESKFRLATMYEEGKGTKRNAEKAVYWYQQTLKQSDRFAEQAQKRLQHLQMPK